MCIGWDCLVGAHLQGLIMWDSKPFKIVRRIPRWLAKLAWTGAPPDEFTQAMIKSAMDIYAEEQDIMNHDEAGYIRKRDDNIIAALLHEVEGNFMMHQPVKLGIHHSGPPAARGINVMLNSDVFVGWDDADKGYKVTKDRFSDQPLPSRCLMPKEYAALVAHCILIGG